MKRSYKILFWMTLTILVISNIFWFYKTIDNAVGQSYYMDSCDEYYQDMHKFKQILETKSTKREAINFLKTNNIEYESFQKGTKFIISFDSFALEYDTDGKLTSHNKHQQD
nr:hypothetical protein [uncultured Draconibacterium sp.]